MNAEHDKLVVFEMTQVGKVFNSISATGSEFQQTNAIK